MFKVSNRNTRKRCLLISKITLKTSERRHLTTSYLPEVTVQNHILDSLQCQFAIKSLLSVLLSSSTARNFNNSRPIYVILWEMRNAYRNIWFRKNSKCQHFLFLKKQHQKWTKFSTFYLRVKGLYSIAKLDILIVCNLLHFQAVFKIWAEKEWFLHKHFDKSLVKNTMNEISEKIEWHIQRPVIWKQLTCKTFISTRLTHNSAF